MTGHDNEKDLVDRARERDATRLKLLLAWAFVGIPLAWGIVHTLRNALLLFE
jgi:hypothetical protein